MPFTSPLFLFGFLPVSITAYVLLPARLRGSLLLVAGVVYYVWSDRFYGPVLFISALLNFGLGLLLSPSPGPGLARVRRARRLVFAAALTLNLGLLVAFKYGNLLASLVHPGLTPPRPRPLPLGISFYTFGLLSYLIDVYQGRVRREGSPWRFVLYASFFPKIASGPIARYRDLREQLEARGGRLEPFVTGAQRFIVGLAKKVLIADTVAAAADEVFALPPGALSTSLAWLGTICYGLQIYFDFSGYSDMAIGLGKMFGVELPENFNYPYAAGSVREFWRRWHISLSTWFRDYLFLPLAYAVSRRIRGERLLGVKAEMWAYAVGMLTTMFLCGLWHGASWTFALWGLWHGLFLVGENSRSGKRVLRRFGGPLRLVLTQGVVLLGWVLFRCAGFGQCGQVARALFGFAAPATGPEGPTPIGALLQRNLVAALVAGIVLAAPLPIAYRRWKTRRLQTGTAAEALRFETWIARGSFLAIVVLLVLSAMAVAGGTYDPFVYRNF